MPGRRLLMLARDARKRAEEALTRSETIHDANAKQKMREIAMKYEELAQQLEEAATDEP
jgi:hypothetical protein